MPLAIAASPQVSRPAVRSPGSAARIDPLDWTKGGLVLVMVAYHSINYSAFKPLAFRFLPFLPPSFVMIAGFVVGAVYTARYDLRTWSPYGRLLVRGIKLFLLFAVLNAGSCILLERNLTDGLFEFADRSSMIFLSGNGREGIFEVLLPIAYFLLLVPALLWLRTRAVGAIPGCAIVVFVLCVALERQEIFSKNLTLLSAGIIGMAFGHIPVETLDRFARKWIWTLLVYISYHICKWIFDDNYAVQMFGAAASVFLLYTCALHLDMSAWAGRQLVMFGRYSLLGYLVQIALIRVMVWVGGGKPQHWGGVIVVGLLTTVLLFCVVNLVNTLRRRNRPADLIYKSVFA
jgi:hypothetical protein